MSAVSEPVLELKVKKERDMTMYFAIRAAVTLCLLAGYYYTIKKDIDYVQFFITTLLLFAPFVLDYYPRQHDDKLEIMLRKWGMLIPSGAIAGVLLMGLFNGDSSYWASNTAIWLKIICIGAGLLVAIFAVLDYNNYNRRSQFTQNMKQHAVEYIEESNAESAEARFKRNEAIKKEGLKRVVIESGKKRKKKKPKI
ncbi:hypothetical protein NSQ30_10975 [Bacillus sp. FSL R7-0651]|uniref:hypothetical protein n=1 Tax=Bacillus TaxID=1386 RepID=UPI001C22CDE0|nr:hypothetical protein [Bacillus pumilus]MBU8573780.1 hypothetical protein [Bacillus pumilus]